MWAESGWVLKRLVVWIKRSRGLVVMGLVRRKESESAWRLSFRWSR